MRKVVVLFLMVMLLVGIVAGCTGSKTFKSEDTGSSGIGLDSPSTAKEDKYKVSEKGVLPITSEKTELTVFMPQQPGVEDYETNKLTLYLEDKTNVHIKWELVPSKDRDQKINLMLAGGNKLPDVIMGGIANATLIEYASQGTFLPLNEYIETQSAYFKRHLNEVDGMRQMVTAPDGNIYSLNSIGISIPDAMSQRMWINEKWLENLNLKMPTTTKELKDVLTAFKTKDPNNNNKADEIPMMGATNGWNTTFDGFLMNSFIQYSPYSPYRVVDGKIEPVYNTEEYRNGIRFLNELVNEGLYDSVSFTQDIDQLKQQFENEEAALIGALPSGGPNSYANMAGDRYRDYAALPPLEGPDGVRLAGYNPYHYILYSNTFVITKDCKHPEIAFKWADYMYSEEVSMFARLGEPGTDWLEPEEGKLDLYGEPALFKPVLLWGNIQNSHWELWHPSFVDFDNKGERSDDPYELQRYLFEATYESYEPYAPDASTFLPPFMYSAEDSKRLNEINTTLASYIWESRDKFIVGNMDIENDWEQYLGEIKKIGYEEVISIMQARYDELNK
jgi:putative aldouronate transport system substrate-binding protein